MAGLLALSLLILLVSCQTTDDPRKGGLFSYNPEAYEKRLQQRRDELTRQQAIQAQAQQRRGELEATVARKEQRNRELRASLDGIDKQVAGLERTLAHTKALTAKQKAQQYRIASKLAELKDRLKMLQGLPDQDLSAKQHVVDELKKRINQLLRQAEELSKM